MARMFSSGKARRTATSNRCRKKASGSVGNGGEAGVEEGVWVRMALGRWLVEGD